MALIAKFSLFLLALALTSLFFLSRPRAMPSQLVGDTYEPLLTKTTTSTSAVLPTRMMTAEELDRVLRKHTDYTSCEGKDLLNWRNNYLL